MGNSNNKYVKTYEVTRLNLGYSGKIYKRRLWTERNTNDSELYRYRELTKT